ncbi:MAG: protein kinase [Chloroflexota bacterium]|nr:protein kinase [Chloroflexota bacterium]
MATSDVQMIGQYRILEPVGQGGMATVYKGYHARLDRIVAIKMIHRQYLDDPGFVARFEREAQIVAKLDHPNLVPVYDYAEHDGQPYIIMKFIEGTTLKHVMAQGAVPIADIIEVMSRVASALDYAHSRGVLHRDIKPSNVMLDRDGMPYLADFGLARLAVGGATTLSQDMLIGTPFYMSPEQARGDDSIDARADIYSLGVVLYELLTGTVPYSGATPYTIIQQHISAELPPPRSINASIPVALEAVLLKALAKDRNQRYAAAGELMGELRTAASENMSTLANPNAISLRESIVVASHARRRTAGVSTPMTPPSTAPGVAAFTAETNRATQTPTAPPTVASPVQARKPRNAIWFVALGVALTLLLLVGLFILTRPGRNLPPAFVENDPPPQVLAIEELSLEDAQALVSTNPDDPSAHLALFRAQLVAGQTEELWDTLAAGLPSAGNAAQYLLSAASTASAMEANGVAIAIVREGLIELADDPSFAAFREYGGRALYDVSTTGNALDLFDLRQIREFDEGAERLQSPIYSTIRARVLLEMQRPRRGDQIAEAILESTLTRAPNLPEALLVLGEVYAVRGQREEARTYWQQALNVPDAPEWVRERARQLLAAPPAR